MSSTDGIKHTSQTSGGLGADPVSAAGARKLPKTAEDYVAIENRLAAQREKPTNNAQFTSIFDQLRDRLGK